MAYSTLEDQLEDLPEAEIIQLTDDPGLNEVNMEVFNGCVADADSEIDGYLVGGGYAVPLLPVPRLIRKVSKSLTCYYLHKRRLKKNMPESLLTDYRNQIRLLESIQSGKVSIGAERSGAASETGSGAYRTNKTAADRMFTDKELAKW